MKLPSGRTISDDIYEHVKEILISQQDLTMLEVAALSKIHVRRVCDIKKDLVLKGLVPPVSRGRPYRDFPFKKKQNPKVKTPIPPPLPAAIVPNVQNSLHNQLIQPKDLISLGFADVSLNDLENDDATRTRILKEVQLLAFSPAMSPDTRMSAMQLWVKIKDIVRAKDLGPGVPRSKIDILNRLVRIFKGVGPALSLEAIQLAFKTGTPDEKTENIEAATPSGTP